MRISKKILSMIMVLLLIVGMVPISTMTAFAAAGTTRHIMLGTSDISGYNATNGYDYIYYGNYEGEPVKWRVLDDETNTGETGLFLLSEDLIGEGGEYGGIYFDTGETNIYQNSDAQIWCNGFYSTAFSQGEQRGIIDTTKSDAEYTSSSNSVRFSAVNNILNADKIFLLSAEEAENENYGFVDNSSRVAKYNRNAGYWWLRSPGNDYSDAVGYAKTDGSISTTDAERTWAARPAFNLETSKVLFTSAADGVTTNTNASEYLTSVGTYSGHEYKLTLLDESRAGFSVTEENMQVVRHQTVRVHFTGAGTGTNDYVSLFIVDQNDNVLHYGSIAKSTGVGNAELEVPSDIPDGNYTIKIFSEQKNGANKTDYASPFDEIALTVGKGHSHCVCGGNTDIGDHTTHTSNQNWQPTDTLPTTAGYYYLTSDITLTESWKPVDGIYLCLNGKVIRQTVANQNAIAFEEECASLTLTDCSTEKHKFSVGDDGVWELDANGDKELTGGVITGTNGLSAVFAKSRSKLNIYNVNIAGNKCTNGGGILTRCICNLYDVTVVGNSASYAGGGIRAKSATLSIYGGEISHNTSLGTGGGIDHSYGELLMDGTLISKNTSMETGGGIWNEGTLTIKGGNITDNSSKNSTGGGIWNHSTRTPAISGDTIITGNTGKGEVNNLHLASDGTVDAKIAVGTMGTNASVGVSVDSNHGMIISSGGKDYADKFFSDNGDYAIAVDGEDLELLEKTVQVGMVTLGNGEYTTDGENIDTGKPTGEGYAYFRDGVLTLNNFTYSGGSAHSNPAIGSDLAAIFCEHDLTIKVEGRNSITRVVTDADTEKDKTLRGIWNDGDLKIVGDSREDILKVTVSGHNGALANAVESINESIFIDNCTLEAKSVTGGYALVGNKAITITRAKVVGSSGIADDSRSTFGIYTVTLTVTDSDVVGIAENNAVGKANGIHMAGKDAKLIFESGSIIGRTSDVSDESYAVYVDTGNVTLPTKYWMRTSASGEYVNGTWDGANVGPYFELTTVEPHTHNYTYSVNGYTITESCNCGHTATAKIERDYNGTAIYNGSAYGAKVVYSEKWKGDKVTELKYYKEQRNDGNLVTECIDAGDYFAVLTVEGVTAELLFTISEKEPNISVKPTVSNIVINSTLSDISLNGGTVLGIGDAELEGKFSWKEPTAVMGTVGP